MGIVLWILTNFNSYFIVFLPDTQRCMTLNQQAHQAKLVSEELPQGLYHILGFSDFKALELK